MTTITTKYIPASNRRGSRIKADAGMKRSITISYPHELKQVSDCHLAAAKALCAKFNWHGNLVSGGTEKGYVFVFLESGKYQADVHTV